MMFTGVSTALITPFYKGEVDYPSLEKLVAHQLDAGIEGLVVNGTTAESPTLTKDEVKTIFEKVKSQVAGQVPILMGTGSNCTRSTIEFTKAAQSWGADGALIVCPYYNKPMAWGVEAHFKAVAEACELPIVLYNIPGRCVIRMTAETIGHLAEIDNIVGVKDATGDIEFLKEQLRLCPNEFTFLSGDDGSAMEFCEQGGVGMISVMSHLIPKQSVEWVEQIKNGAKAKDTSEGEYRALIYDIYCEANPIPTKWALHKLGVIQSPELRLPLTTLTEANHARMQKVIDLVKSNF